MNLLLRRKLHYYIDDRLANFLPAHLRAASDVGITIHGAWWGSDGSGWVDVEGIDTDDERHVAVGGQAGRPDGSNGGYRRHEVATIPSGLTPIVY